MSALQGDQALAQTPHIAAFEFYKALARAQGRAHWLLILLVVFALTNFAAGGAATSQQYLQQRIAAGEKLSGEAAERSAAKVPGYGVLRAGLFIVTGIVWLLWLHRSYGLLRFLGTKVTRFSPGWAVGCWFVPFVNLVRPYQIVKELRLRSRNLNATAEPAPQLAGEVTALWWLTWLAANVTEVLYAALLWSAETPADIIRADKTGFAGDNLEAAAALLAIYLVRQIRNAQKLATFPAIPPVTPPVA
ncbi:MAG TPA: DUF4328 domain-containing protein [Thermoanaerobaculia bacterium]|nr:DUF4328 domain-containing protein [Thermoanaerobaculia bacterium]